MRIPPEWAGPYWTSIGFAILLVVVSFVRPKAARILFAVVFLAASIVNARLAIVNPREYLNYADFALVEAYRSFILGFFADHIQAIVLAIAFGQAITGVLLLMARMTKLGCFAASIFLLAIAPLGVGSAFPFSIICLIGLIEIAMHRSPKIEMEKALAQPGPSHE